jgi:hypothetical protein
MRGGVRGDMIGDVRGEGTNRYDGHIVVLIAVKNKEKGVR